MKNILFLAGMVTILQLAPHNLVLASTVSTPSSTVKTTSAQDYSNPKTQKTQNDTSTTTATTDASPQTSSQAQSKKNTVSSETETVKNDFVYSSINEDNFQNVALDKIWTIELNQPVELSSAKNSIKIVNQSTKAEIPINVSLSEYNMYINVAALSNYDPDTYYTLTIDGSLTSKRNEHLKDSITLNFKTAPKIVSVNTITTSIGQGDSYTLPSTVTANLSNGSTEQVSITWDKPVDTSEAPGDYAYEGTVKGYDGKVNLDLTIKAKSSSSSSNTSIWIWELQKQVDKYGGIDNLISELKSLGINDVCIKYHDGTDTAADGADFKGDFLKYVGDFKNAGFKVGTWGYNRFNDPSTEVNIIMDAIKNSDYYVFDAEDDVVNKTSQTESVLKTIRQYIPNAVLGYTSFPIESYHQDVPYAIFNEYCDFTAPQLYWGELQWSVTKATDKMIQDYKNAGLDKPLYPLIQTYAVPESDYQTYSNYNFNQTGLWSLDDMQSTCVDYLTNNHGKLTDA
ncbi:hypothetical protein J2Z42_000850 [Clostridium algifaecis]|uniref:Uncharacterized protein n=1 Tax=Clostridium algifaecis TaxID=1472040 RepID=A0ABS4KQ77_9CLOT|nr:hypothetical protein [Clostridium algifaecis]